MTHKKKKVGLASTHKATRQRVASIGGKAPHPKGRGFQNLTPEKRKQIARMGGKARHNVSV